jgi:hypothetical protein
MKLVSKLSFYQDLKSLTRSELHDILRYSLRIHQIKSQGSVQIRFKCVILLTARELHYGAPRQCDASVLREFLYGAKMGGEKNISIFRRGSLKKRPLQERK